MDTHVYIDGFNQYYGLLEGTPHKWLDLERFCDQSLPETTFAKSIISPRRWTRGRTIPISPCASKPISTRSRPNPCVEVHLGTFMSSVISQVVVDTDPVTGRYRRSGGKPVLKINPVAGTSEKMWTYKSEEKGSDVNLAAHLLRDAYRGACACGVVISNDSDLLAPIRMAKADCGLTIGLVPPRPKGSVELKRLADFKVEPRVHRLASLQLPDPVAAGGLAIHKPAGW
ncbi:NYN domain-containing protein [Sphingobium yanoikuyae]|uniref:NYN domain-containing protein n=1 Tax=Sphingobium yanoikuyae TaxID=13690 RepID=UPI000AD7CFAE|nr:NYN domain-containing protein [Sphingobium yanoikuyae]MDV3481999.1 NYN domain-containing protein [Sphingobium yanoikuyae]